MQYDDAPQPATQRIVVAYHAVDDRSRFHDAVQDVSQLDLSDELSGIMGDQDMDAYNDVLEAEFAAEEKAFESHLKQALVSRMANLSNRTAIDLVAEMAAFQKRLDHASAAAASQHAACLAAIVFALNKLKDNSLLSTEQLFRAVGAQRRTFAEHAEMHA